MKNCYHGAFLPVLCAVSVLTGSCRPEVDLPVTDNANLSYYVKGNTYRDIAFTFWQGVNLNYVFWDIEPVRLWDDVLDEYLPKIGALGTWDPYDSVKNNKFEAYLTGMAAPLHDGHFMVLAFSPQEARVNARFPEGYEDKANPALTFWLNDWSGELPEDRKNWNFAKDLIIPKYLANKGSWAKSADGLRIAQGKIDMTDEEPKEYIAYLYFSEFYLVQTMANETADKKPVTDVLNAFWTNLRSEQCKGIIFDVRGNAGGLNSNIEYLIRPLLTEKLHFANLRTKKNESRLSYTPWIPYTINPNNPIDNAGKIPVVALINDYSVSCGELLPLAVRAMPNGYLIGTRTYGATGPRIGDDYPNALNDGGFTVRWSSGYSFSVTQAGYQTRGKNHENYEGIGIEPDKRVPFSRKEFTNNGKYDADGCDKQLKAAIEYITKWPAD